MLKLLLGVVLGAASRDALIRLYRSYKLPYQDRIDAMYFIARYGCLTPESHNAGCQCISIRKEDR